jgi:small subunit ribosomal protein S35
MIFVLPITCAWDSADAYPKKGAPNDEPPGEGPILRWQTRVVLSPGGDAFHPKNRKVKVSVTVKELELTPIQKERLLFMVGKRYNPNKDELTIISERFVHFLLILDRNLRGQTRTKEALYN